MLLGANRAALVLEIGYIQGITTIVSRPRPCVPERSSEVMTMPRTVDEILAHADELAARFESYEPVEANEVDVTALTALRDAVAEQAQAERHVLDAIRGARNAGMSWAAIGNMVGISGEAARQRYQHSWLEDDPTTSEATGLR